VAEAGPRPDRALALAEQLAEAVLLLGGDVENGFGTAWEDLLDAVRARHDAKSTDALSRLHARFERDIPPSLANAWRELSDEYTLQEIATKDAALLFGAAIGARFRIVPPAEIHRFLRVIDGLFGRQGL